MMRNRENHTRQVKYSKLIYTIIPCRNVQTCTCTCVVCTMQYHNINCYSYDYRAFWMRTCTEMYLSATASTVVTMHSRTNSS